MSKGYIKEILDGNVVVFRAMLATREFVDEWFQDVAAVFAQALEQGTRARLMYDLRNLDIITPYSLQRVEELERVPLPDDWRVATLLTNPFLASVVNYLISVARLPAMRHHSRVFTDEAQALAWLREKES
jgi:hypothetical protein